ENHAIDDALAVLLDRHVTVTCEFDGQTAAERSSDGDPRARRQLVADPCAHGVPLILRDRKPTGGAQRTLLVISEEQSSCNRQRTCSDQVGVADKSRQRPPARHFNFYFGAVNVRVVKSHWEADTRIQQQVVVREVRDIALELRDVDTQRRKEALRDTRFEEVTK